MSINRRKFLLTSVASVAGTALASAHTISTTDIENLQPLAGEVVPISVDERKARIAKAQKLMVENKIDAIYLDMRKGWNWKSST